MNPLLFYLLTDGLKWREICLNGIDADKSEEATLKIFTSGYGGHSFEASPSSHFPQKFLVRPTQA